MEKDTVKGTDVNGRCLDKCFQRQGSACASQIKDLMLKTGGCEQ